MKTVALLDGLTVGETKHTEAELRLPLAGDIIDAGVESERAVLTEHGWVLLMSPTLIAQHTLRRQIVRIGEHKGPLSIGEMRKLSQHDLGLLQAAAEVLDAALARALDSRGRSEAPGGGAGGQ